MEEKEHYKDLIGKGADNYISVLKNAGLYDEVVERIKKKNSTEAKQLIIQMFETQLSFTEYLFSDLDYSLDYFYEGFELNIKKIIDLNFKGLDFKFQIITEYYDSTELKDSVTYFSEEEKNDFDLAFSISTKCSQNGNTQKWRIVLQIENDEKEFTWNDWGEDNLINLLNFLNRTNEDLSISKRWFPIVSSYGSNFIFTDPIKYKLIIELDLMPPEGYVIDEIAVVYYPKGINSVIEL